MSLAPTRTPIKQAFGLGAAAITLSVVSACGSATSSGTATGSGGSNSGSGTSAPATLTKADFATAVTGALRKAGTYHIVLKETLGSTTIKGHGDASSGTPAQARMTVNIPGGATTSIVTGGLYYLKIPQLHTAKPWLKVDPHSKSGLGALIGQLGGNSTDPASSLQAMSSAARVTAGSKQTIGGVQTTEYSVVVPTKALRAALGYSKEVLAMMPKELPYKVWVGDSDHLVRQISSKVVVGGESSSTLLRFSRFGESVKITAPPASQTTTKAPGLSALSGSTKS